MRIYGANKVTVKLPQTNFRSAYVLTSYNTQGSFKSAPALCQLQNTTISH